MNFMTMTCCWSTRELGAAPRQQVGVERARQLDRRGGAGKLDRAFVVVERGGWFLGADMVDVGVVGQAIQPGQEGSTLPPIPADRLPGFEEDLLGEILGLGMAAGAEVQVPVHPLDEAVVQLAKRVRVSGDDDTIDECHDDWVVGALE